MTDLSTYIVSGNNENHKKMTSLLSDNNIQIINVNESLNPIDSSIFDNIKGCDFITAIVTEDNPNVFYELGYAQGLGKPIFLIVNKDTNFPLNLQGILYTFIEDYFIEEKYFKGVNFNFQQFLKNYPIKKGIKKKNSQKNPKSEKILSINKEEILAKIDLLRNNDNQNASLRGLLFEKIVADLFANLDLGAVVPNERKELNDIDFALWVDELETELGNPILVELKMGNLSRNTLERAEKQLLTHFEDSNAKTGLIIYLDNNNRKFERSKKENSSNILYIEFNDLINNLKQNSFDQILLQLKKQSLIRKGGK
ncbi:hypothetical protein ABET51_11070 [Metabacillus fastidiosus]|uniref:hypothetical protein n=1 Tax=Metabacillus fastidiosus TaxID=1458 RepID=UPI003D2D72B3